jgi:hypothetical protein
MRIGLRMVPVLGIVLASGLLASGAGAASGTSGTLYVWGTPGNGATSQVLFTGVIADHGTGTSIDKNGKVDQNGNYVKIVLQKGSFEVNSTTLNQKANAGAPKAFSSSNCSFYFDATAPVTLFDGTGSYAGISGTVNVTETFAAIGPKNTSGAHKGQCNQSNSAKPVAFWGSITGSGTVTLK